MLVYIRIRIDGKLVEANRASLILGENLFPISLENSATGIYFVHVNIGTETFIQKVSINK